MNNGSVSTKKPLQLRVYFGALRQSARSGPSFRPPSLARLLEMQREGERSDGIRRSVRSALQRRRDSPVWHKAVGIIAGLALATSFERPVHSKAARWAVQSTADALSPLSREAPPADIVFVAAHIAEAMLTPHPLQSLASELASDITVAAAWIAQHKLSCAADRQVRFNRLQGCAHDFQSWTEELRSVAPNHIRHCTVQNAHLAFADVIRAALGLPDSNLVEDLCCGAPAIGDIPDSGCFRAVVRESSMCIHDLDHDAWNLELAAMVEAKAARPAPFECDALLWQRTMTEVEQGYAVPIGSKADVDARFGRGRWRAAHRFGVTQNGKIRPCDNMRASLHNSCTHLHEKLVCESADFLARAAALFFDLLGDSDKWSFGFSTDDVEAAFRRFPCSQPQFVCLHNGTRTRKLSRSLESKVLILALLRPP